jgi:hypothetical protein
VSAEQLPRPAAEEAEELARVAKEVRPRPVTEAFVSN